MTDLRALRQQLRAQRRELDPHRQAQLSADIVGHVARHRLFRAARHIACYLPNDGEVDITPLMTQAWAMGKTVYLPVLSEIHHNHLHFLPYRAEDPLVANRFGIPEPRLALHQTASRKMISPPQLDLVLTPLVGFDAQGNRLGMGGGFYDRTFAFLRRRRYWRKPHLMGVAYGFQQVDGRVDSGLPRQPWDVPMKAIVTESEVRMFADGEVSGGR
jgi:5-formyltetrahydrofolate cyclo-ligase